MDNQRLPKAAVSFKVLVILFIFVFLLLILINVFIFSSEILSLSNDIEFIDLPQKLINAYCRGLQGAIGLSQVALGFYSSAQSLSARSLLIQD